MESFFGRLKVEMFYGEEKTFRNYEDFRKALEKYMLWYNQERVKEYLQWKSPIQAISTSATLWYHIVVAGPNLGVQYKIDYFS